MGLLPATQRIVEEVERLTKRPVHIEEDEKLKVMAQMTVARGDMPLHQLRYKPTGTAPPDYFVAFQCGFVIRLYQAPPEKRFEYCPGPDGRRKINDLLSDRSFPTPVREMGDFLLQGLITQLRSIPIGLRVDEWLLATCPELRDLLVAGVKAQLEENLQAIPIGAKGVFPAKFYKGNVTMNAAYAAYWSRKWNDTSLTLPYKAAALLDDGLRLLRIFDRVPADPANDPDLVEQWAFELGLKGWYVLIPHRLND